MRILALEPYYGGSHAAFLNGWISQSCHDWTVIDLPPSKWKWRMRHSAVSMNELINQRSDPCASFDLIFCSDMLNLAEFKGLAKPKIASLPTVIYFHENQFTYPVQVVAERDLHFGFTNVIAALAADQVWFNSDFHRNEFLSGAEKALKKMPDYQLLGSLKTINDKSIIAYPGISQMPSTNVKKTNTPVSILWVARWEHDKNPEDFFEAIKSLDEAGHDFRLTILGEEFRNSPDIFRKAKDQFGDRIKHYGFMPDRKDYLNAVASSDIVISTANHEFFGIAIVEAIACGVFPLLPKRLAYPELLPSEFDANHDDFFYTGTLTSLKKRLITLVERFDRGELWLGNRNRASLAMNRFSWTELVPKYDSALERLIKKD